MGGTGGRGMVMGGGGSVARQRLQVCAKESGTGAQLPGLALLERSTCLAFRSVFYQEERFSLTRGKGGGRGRRGGAKSPADDES